jgi:methylated-DNA-[protein]-cysteine S-methyltransferase
MSGYGLGVPASVCHPHAMRDPDPVHRTWQFETPLGLVVAMATEDALVGLWFDGSERAPSVREALVGSNELIARVGRQLDDYFAGARTAFEVPLRLDGTSFQRVVWSALVTVPHGHTSTYGSIARQIGRPDAARAVGAANGQNPISIIVPCHRLVGAHGALTGYGGGLERKAWLLDHERRVAEASAAPI